MMPRLMMCVVSTTLAAARCLSVDDALSDARVRSLPRSLLVSWTLVVSVWIFCLGGLALCCLGLLSVLLRLTPGRSRIGMCVKKAARYG